MQKPGVPIVVGGHTELAARRAARVDQEVRRAAGREHEIVERQLATRMHQSLRGRIDRGDFTHDLTLNSSQQRALPPVHCHLPEQRQARLAGLQADQLGVTVQRPVDQETTALGAAYLAGLAEGIWPSLAAIAAEWSVNAVFEPEALMPAALELAQAIADKKLVLEPSANVESTLAALKAIPGIGDWTAQLVAMRALAWPDAWPAADIGLMNALGSRDAKHITALAEAWRPWRAYAVMRLWHELETRPS